MIPDKARLSNSNLTDCEFSLVNTVLEDLTTIGGREFTEMLLEKPTCRMVINVQGLATRWVKTFPIVLKLALPTIEKLANTAEQLKRER